MLLFDYKIPVEADRALRDAYVALAFAFRRLEGSARSRDTELCSTLLKVRAEIERVLKAQDAAPAEALAAPSASQEALREAIAEMRATAADLRDPRNSDCDTVRQARYWEEKADRLAALAQSDAAGGE
jgi:hypothetical protein